MPSTSVTVSLVPQVRGGPFIFWDDLAGAASQARALGFDGVEVFVPSAEAIDVSRWKELLQKNGLKLAAVGTGAGWALHRWHLSHPDSRVRQRARHFAASIIERAGLLGAPAIIGSMQGRAEAHATRAEALHWLAESLELLAGHAQEHGRLLLLEPLNRYETNLLNCVADATELIHGLTAKNVRILADFFHMNIEERSLPAALESAASLVGHVHLADSNRRPAGFGHTAFAPLGKALKKIKFRGFISGEALPYPDPAAAAQQTITACRTFFDGAGGD